MVKKMVVAEKDIEKRKRRKMMNNVTITSLGLRKGKEKRGSRGSAQEQVKGRSKFEQCVERRHRRNISSYS